MASGKGGKPAKQSSSSSFVQSTLEGEEEEITRRVLNALPSKKNLLGH